MKLYALRGFLGACAIVFFSLAPLSLLAQTATLPTVGVVIIGKEPASQPLHYLGRVEAIHSVDVFTRTEGFIQKVNFTEGEMVSVGDLLFEINPDVHQSEIEQAAARVGSAEASLNLAELTFRRLDTLARNSATSRADSDKARADRDIARANLTQAQANQRAMELRLSFTRITAPIAGRIGHTRFDVGSFISPASGSLVDIVQLDPIRVVISIREHDFISATANDSRLHLDLLGKDFSPQLRLANGKIYPTRGTFGSIDNRIDIQTGTVDVRARFANPANLLLPGGAVDVTLDATEPPLVEVVPIAALQQNQSGHFVLMLDKDDTVVVRPVTLGMQLGQTFAIEKGLAVGDRVIVEGLQRVNAGMKVNPVPAMPMEQ